jgi:hypothetical protein
MRMFVPKLISTVSNGFGLSLCPLCLLCVLCVTALVASAAKDHSVRVTRHSCCTSSR